jgi:hypothetical protein
MPISNHQSIQKQISFSLPILIWKTIDKNVVFENYW